VTGCYDPIWEDGYIPRPANKMVNKVGGN